MKELSHVDVAAMKDPIPAEVLKSWRAKSPSPVPSTSKSLYPRVHPPSVSDILKGKGKKRAITIITSDEDSDGKNSEDGESDSPSKKVEKGVYQFRSPDN
jgi:hypothetical protein